MALKINKSEKKTPPTIRIKQMVRTGSNMSEQV